MKRAIAMLAASALIAVVPATLAQAKNGCPDFSAVDADQSGTVSFDELSAAMPGVTQDLFNKADVDQSGDLSKTEYGAFDCSGGTTSQ